MPVEYRILGPLEAAVDGQPARLGMVSDMQSERAPLSQARAGLIALALLLLPR